MHSPRVVSPEEWIESRKVLMAKEKELTRLRDRLAAERRALPWVRVEKEYVFDTPHGTRDAGRSLRRAQPALPQALHVGARPGHPVRRVLPRGRPHRGPARAPPEPRCVVRRGGARADRRRSRPFAGAWGGASRGSRRTAPTSTTTSTSRSPRRRSRRAAPSTTTNTGAPRLEDLSGDSVFIKDDAGRIFHTYSTFGRGGEEFLGIYRYLDATPKGRSEDGPYRSAYRLGAPAEHVRPGRYGRSHRALPSAGLRVRHAPRMREGDRSRSTLARNLHPRTAPCP